MTRMVHSTERLGQLVDGGTNLVNGVVSTESSRDVQVAYRDVGRTRVVPWSGMMPFSVGSIVLCALPACTFFCHMRLRLQVRLR